jgi:hypothetical protein
VVGNAGSNPTEEEDAGVLDAECGVSGEARPQSR